MPVFRAFFFCIKLFKKFKKLVLTIQKQNGILEFVVEENAEYDKLF